MPQFSRIVNEEKNNTYIGNPREQKASFLTDSYRELYFGVKLKVRGNHLNGDDERIRLVT